MWDRIRDVFETALNYALSAALAVGEWVVDRARGEREERDGGWEGYAAGDSGGDEIDIPDHITIVHDSDEIPEGEGWRCAFADLRDAIEYSRDIPCPVEIHYIDGAWWVYVVGSD